MGPRRARVAPGMEDEQTLPRAATANERFRRYVIPEAPVLLRVARRLTGGQQDAEDAVQETLIRAFRSIDRFDGRHPRAWLLTILRNATYNMHRRKRPHLADSPEELLQLPAAGPEGRNGTEERVLDGVVEIEIAEALFSLSGSFREVVVLVDVDGLTYQEAADVLGVPIGTVMSRLHRARSKMRKRLERAGFSADGARR
jgi:RNA polymerase sigma-70 factor, ECF subfamily